MIKFHKITDTSIIPKRGTDGAAGFDLHADGSYVVEAGDRAIINTGIVTEFADSIVGMIWPRSGLAAKNGIDTMAGVIDSDYRGEIKVVLINHGYSDFTINHGDRIAQILFQPVVTIASEGGKLSETERGANGFGSTGVNNAV